MNTRLEIDDVDVLVEGEGPHTVVMLHGWPDTPALWDDTVAALRNGYRCVRFCLPGYDLSKPPRPMSVAAVNGLIRKIVDAVSPHEPVTLLLHDWGCLFGYEFAARHADRVARVVGVDIGDTSAGVYLRSLSGKQKRMIAGYQIWLAVAWKLGRWLPGLANRMTRHMARKMGCRNPPEHITWQMNYPYAMGWFGEQGGLRGVARVDKLLGISMPALYIYGRRKPFMFHSEAWVAQLTQAPGCEVLALDTGHWVMRQKPLEFNACVRAWLDTSTSSSAV
ncbi:alpha/beta hydrolase [Hydrogenophaga sp. 2FB]|uniref:alpha/beta fold hydrolase n=1 Tax=Hydrogenophaga sp. 2FB TaxID=2502187 RepID=UPI0010F78509|nr:alpha/beta hydrolase [Hydrogenophaga sp. 2FB]